MIVLSLFDGMSCGQIALRELGIKIDKYYASEIDKFAIHNTMVNFPDTVRLGDVRTINARKLGAYRLTYGRQSLPIVQLCRETCRNENYAKRACYEFTKIFGTQKHRI